LRPALKAGKAEVKRIARERISILLNQALKVYRDYPWLADRYVDLARRLSMRYKVRIPKPWRLLICRKCKRLMIPGFSARVRVRQRREPHIAFTCLRCGRVKRILLRRVGKGLT